ncbi:MAG: hypothetical protein DRO23_05125 [Thermoprotei archaeon]|nr:MAG: hypothetical protein DRO23_05125 [Thermoprotei archaeon]
MNYNVENVFYVAKEVAVDVAKWLREVQGKVDKYEPVKWGKEDVTRKIDLEAEERILDGFLREHIKIYYVSEERGVIRTCNKPEFIVIADPLDGSNNYVAGIPYASVSIAITKYTSSAKLSDISVGIVAEIFRDKVYYAIKGKGAFENNGKLKTVNFGKYPFILGYLNMESYDVFKEIEKIFGPFKLRSLGSASLDIIYVAKNIAAAFVDLRSKLRNVDVAASLLILLESNGKVESLHRKIADISILDVEKVYSIIAYSGKYYEEYKVIGEIARKYIKPTLNAQQ